MELHPEFLAHLRDCEARLTHLIDRFHQARVLVVGDLTLDEFLTGQVERLSREAPVLILRHEHTDQVPGGGANAIYNLVTLGGQVKAVGLVGQDSQGKVLRGIFDRAGVDTRGILVDPDRPTVTKTRISGHARQSVTQQIVRVDRKSEELPSVELQQQLVEYIHQQIGNVDAVVCSDYGDGVLTAPVIAAALSHSLAIVDTQKDLLRYRGATLFTPNLPEAEQAVGFGITNEQTLFQAGEELLELTQAQQMLITQGDSGMSLFDRTANPKAPSQARSRSTVQTASLSGKEVHLYHVPAFNRTEVFDVTGAGDTVVAALTLALIAGASPWEATVLGNLAASIVVRQFGTSTTTPDEMKTALHELLHAS